jgi:hypothetical protein
MSGAATSRSEVAAESKDLYTFVDPDKHRAIFPEDYRIMEILFLSYFCLDSHSVFV